MNDFGLNERINGPFRSERYHQEKSGQQKEEIHSSAPHVVDGYIGRQMSHDNTDCKQ